MPGRRSKHAAPTSSASSAATIHTLQGPIHSMTIVRSYAGALLADGAVLNLFEPGPVSRFVGAIHAVASPHYSRSAEEALLGHCGPGAGHGCPLHCNYFLWALDVKTVLWMAHSTSSAFCSLGLFILCKASPSTPWSMPFLGLSLSSQSPICRGLPSYISNPALLILPTSIPYSCFWLICPLFKRH